jgi:hypothetical protein
MEEVVIPHAMQVRITLKAARQVGGHILKYVPDGTTPDPRYRFYM